MNKFAITMGDPCGIGPEIIVKALQKQPQYINSAIIFGNAAMFNFYRKKLHLAVGVHEMKTHLDFQKGFCNVYDPNPVLLDRFKIGQINALGGDCAYKYVISAIGAALASEISFITTAPLNKKAMHLAKHFFDGHTEIFAKLSKTENYAMLLWSPKLKCIHVSSHISLIQACKTLNTARIINVIKLADSALKKLGCKKPRIAVAGLNPHASEDGLFGDEEKKIISPAVKKCKRLGINVTGPHPPDTVFLKAYEGRYDIVVGMYHDQGHIPIKLLSFDTGVNITVGLGIVRTSVDHGTAFDIAGKFQANCDSLLQAIILGRKLSK
ncbi:MAG: 4-hydroxythreonine-4-phosphate dehydrogenase PdxA [Elusimicrobiota bacterium]|jgi:4-hydroxythreonine-4-phosphate dehydrogenase|nr:4-hydroxythreonine-4-phosphate dehydrogenase PdxA [Elusimicrobiota bacterium]